MSNTDRKNVLYDEYDFIRCSSDAISLAARYKVEANKRLFEIIGHNNTVVKEFLKGRKEIVVEQVVAPSKSEEKKEVKTETKIFNVDSYIAKIKSSSNEELEEILPNADNDDYTSIITAIILRINEEIKAAQSLLIHTRSFKTTAKCKDEGIQEIESLMRDYQIKKDIIKQYDLRLRNEDVIEEEDLEESATTDKAKVVFLKKSSGKTYLESDISSFKEYDITSAHILLSTLHKENRLLRLRKYVRGDLSILKRIRNADVRILFTRLNNVIVILGATLKNQHNPKTYKDLLCLRVVEFNKQKKDLEQLIQCDEFIEDSTKELESLISSLEEKAPKKSGC